MVCSVDRMYTSTVKRMDGDTEMANAHEVARYIVHLFQEAGDPVSNLKLQKLLYYVQGWHLALEGEQAYPERLEAWVHGPVQPAVYGAYKQYRWNPIVGEVAPVDLPAALKETVDSVVETYGGDTGYQLELRTHQEPPWQTARGNLPPDQESNEVISVASLTDFFKKLAANGEAQ
jgi:uncharacterized phage-associated protein